MIEVKIENSGCGGSALIDPRAIIAIIQHNRGQYIALEICLQGGARVFTAESWERLIQRLRHDMFPVLDQA